MRILVVDDNVDSADTLTQLLTILGHETGTAYDGEAAIAAADAMRPNVVLLDIGMPKLNGYEACRRIREQEWGKSIFLVALTGWGQAEDRARTREAGLRPPPRQAGRSGHARETAGIPAGVVACKSAELVTVAPPACAARCLI